MYNNSELSGSFGQEQFIDDSTVSAEKTWSSSKINEKTRDWTLIDSSATTQTLPNNWRELIVVAYNDTIYSTDDVCYTFHVTREMVLGGKLHRFYNGYGYLSADYGGARVDVTETTATLIFLVFSGTQRSNNKMSVR